MAKRRTFLPFGEFLPDHRLLRNPGLTRAFGVTPISGNYLQAPAVQLPGSQVAGIPGSALGGAPPYGFGLHQVRDGSGLRNLYAYYGSETSLFEMDVEAMPGFNETNRSKGGGGPYSFTSSPPSSLEFWWFTTYGESVVSTNLNDPVQLLSTPGSGAFEDMITSTFKPQGRLAFPIRFNLFLAYCFVPSTYDGLAATTHPNLVCWSQNDNLRAYGSSNVDPALVGAGYQTLNNDLGVITAGIGGDFGLVFQEGGITRIDGPPYEFRTIVVGDTSFFPYSVFRVDGDIYFWGNAGPSVLIGGEPPVRRLGLGKLQRALLDSTTGFGADFARAASLGVRDISGGADLVNDLLRWSYTPASDSYAGQDRQDEDGTPPTLLLDYNLREDRFTVSRAADVEGSQDPRPGRDFFLRQAPARESFGWGPFEAVYGLKEDYDSSTGNNWFLYRYRLDGGFGNVPDIELRTGIGRLVESGATSRVVAVRPTFTTSAGLASTLEGAVEVFVHTRNKPWDDDTTKGPFTTVNSDGWVPTPETVGGSYHALTLKLLASVEEINEVHELEGLEVEYVEGGSYGT